MKNNVNHTLVVNIIINFKISRFNASGMRWFWSLCPRSKRVPTLPVVLLLVVLYILYYYFSESSNAVKSSQTSRVKSEIYYKVLHKHFKLSGGEWRLKTFGNPDADYNCSAFHSISYKQFIATGWTKETYKAEFKSRVVALKYVNPYGREIVTCKSEPLSFADCYMNSASKLLLEILSLKVLKHSNVIELLGYCVPELPISPDKSHTIGLMMEYGEPLNVIQLLQMSWPSRLKICLGLSKLLHHFSSSPLGSVALNDFRRQQFVLVEGELKLVDTDYIGLENPSCVSNNCCISSVTPQTCTPCVNGFCENYNEKLNIFNAERHFVKHILPYDVPPSLVSLTNDVVKAFKNSSWGTSQILTELENLTRLTNKYFKSLLSFPVEK